MTDTTALETAANILIDAFNDTESALGKDGVKWTDYGNILGDVLAVVPSAGELAPEIKALDLPAIKGLVDTVASKLSLPEGKAADIAAHVVTLFDSAIGSVVPAVEALVKAIKAKDAPAEAPVSTDATPPQAATPDVTPAS